MGWENTIPFLILPVFLVISQFASMQLMQPKNQDPEQQQANFVLKLLPLMIGWFSLNVPSALCIYWVVNNIVTTASTLLIRNAMADPVVVSGGGAASAPPRSSPFAAPPLRDRPAGFGSIDDSEVKPLTSIDAEIVDVEVEDVEEAGTGMASTRSSSSKVRACLSTDH
jgi:YidC/Oxa1 family membrane protein insertase